MIRFTGHPLVDVGAATIAAFAKKRHPSQLTEADLDAVANFISEQYVVNPLKSFLTVAFPNSGFTQPAFEKTPERRVGYARRVLYGYRAGTPRLEEQCVFTGEPAVAISFSDSDKLPPGRAFRQHIPLLTGEGVINFYPGGDAGLPVSGEALFCIQAFPLGCAKCSGRLLAVHSDNERLMVAFARNFLEDNLKAMQIAQQAGSKKMPESPMQAGTLLIDTLLRIELARLEAREEEEPCSITAYHLSNFGASPKLDIYHLPLEITGFLQQAISAEYRDQWNALRERGWQVSRPKKRGKKAGQASEERMPRWNVLYEDLFRLPDNARTFVRRYFLRIPQHQARGDDPRRSYSLRDEANLVSWKLTELFLRRVMNMDKERIEQIRELGDRLAAYISGQNDKRFFTAFSAARRYDHFRMALIRANLAHVKRGNPPLITLDPYIEIFEEGEEMARPDWRLARDLVLIRMVEQLYQQGWLGSNPDAIPEFEEEPESAS
jgi:CRISPR-associated protein Cst1